MPTPIMRTGLDKRFVAVDATPWTVWPATFATEPIVCPATFETAPMELPIEDVTDPTICPGIEIRLFKSPPVVDGDSEDTVQKHLCFIYYGNKIKKKDDHILILE